MRIVVYDIAASKGGGGESILTQYFNTAEKKTEDEWWFFVSIHEFRSRESDRIHVICVGNAENSKFKTYITRKIYEIFKLKSIIKKIKPDEIISLQNMVAPVGKCFQTVYLHQPFQFSPVKYSFIRKAERHLAFRQKVICQIIRHKLRKADRVIVQTNWMKQSVAEWANYPKEHIIVETPIVTPPTIKKQINICNNVFIYPANANLHKNHRIIVEAGKILNRNGFHNYKVLFTLSEESLGLSSELLKEIKKENLPFDYIGHLNKEVLFEYYQSYVTLFPSYVETFGLPLLEAKSVGGRIIVSDCPYAHEILDNYDKVEFVSWNDANGWATAIANFIEK